MAIYNRIKDLREDNDKTQAEIAEYLGTSAQHYGKYELGHAEIPFERAIMLAKYYNVSLDYIAGLTNQKKGLHDTENDNMAELHSFLASLTDHDKLILSRLAACISEI
ncbi:MAG: helix-turn-helix transcriptional regulator [Oscillospiraceae bacterium]|nr:helix-turn-helix transcriptional regulator [Oscillospiraceae bacterium]